MDTEVKSGAYQGSALGLMQFNLIIKDLERGVNKVGDKFVHYAV